MSWNNIGASIDLEPGQSAFWEYSWANSQDMGLQLAGPNITEVDPSTLGTMVASNQGKRVDGGSDNNVMITYVVTIANIGNEAAIHNLQGGGVS
jgi:hypothetical protein